MLEGKKPITYESKNFKKNGEACWLLTSITPILNNKGGIDKFVSIDSDITKQKKAENDLTKTTIFLSQLLENVMSGVVFEDETGNIVYINRNFIRLFNIDRK